MHANFICRVGNHFQTHLHGLDCISYITGVSIVGGIVYGACLSCSILSERDKIVCMLHKIMRKEENE